MVWHKEMHTKLQLTQKNNAISLRNQADYNAVIERNNAQSKSDLLKFKGAEAIFNKLVNLQAKTQATLEFGRQVQQELGKATLVTKNKNLLEALEAEAFQKLTAKNNEYLFKGLTFDLQSKEYRRQAEAERAVGEQKATLVKLSGYNQARNLEAQARVDEAAGSAAMLGAFAGAAGSFASMMPQSVGSVGATATPSFSTTASNNTPPFYFRGTPNSMQVINQAFTPTINP